MSNTSSDGAMIQRPSVASLLIQMRASGQPLAVGTAFAVVRNDAAVLVTNWHNLAGRDPVSGQPRHSSGALPDEVVILHNEEGRLGNWVHRPEPLIDGHERPLWRQHHEHGRRVDVVALPLTNLDGVDLHPHDPWSETPPLRALVSDSVSIIGFPFGITGGGAAGIWVRGFIASEPALDFNNLPSFLVDSRTRQGQSGSPVIAYSAGGAMSMADGSMQIGGGVVETFLGVYSGRINAESDLGVVWKASAVREVIEQGVRPERR